MPSRIAIIDAHPDPSPGRLVHALADAYAAGALRAGHQIHRIDLSSHDVLSLTSRGEWERSPPLGDVSEVQGAIAWANHVVIIHPLWLGSMPGKLKCLLEQVLRPGFAFNPGEQGLGGGRMAGRSARIIVTMGMPAAVYWLFYFAHGTLSLKRNVLEFVGFRPVRILTLGAVETSGAPRIAKWIARVGRLGEQAR